MNEPRQLLAEPETETTAPIKLDQFSYDDQIVRMFAFATLVWGLVATLAGLIVAILLVVPQWTFTEYVSFGRLRPLQEPGDGRGRGLFVGSNVPGLFARRDHRRQP